MTRSNLLSATIAMGLTIACCAPPAMAVDIYRWIDAAGVVNYGERVPEGVTQVQKIEDRQAKRLAPTGARNVTASTSTTSTSSASAGSNSPSNSNLSEQQRALANQLEQEKNARLADVSRNRATNCAKAREQFDQLTQYARVRVTDGTGTYRALSEEERTQRIAEAQSQILEFCTEA